MAWATMSSISRCSYVSPAASNCVLELLVEDALELVLEHAVVGLEDGVLRRQVHRVILLQRKVKRRAGEILDGLLEVVHPHDDAAVLGHLHHFVHDRLAAVVRSEGHRDGARPVHLEVRGPVLVAERVTADDDRLGPARNQPRHILDHDRRAEDGAAENVSDGAVGREPHLLEVELLDAGLVGGDGRAFDAHAVLLDGVGGVDGDLVVGLVAVLDAEVVVVQVDVEVRQDQHLFDHLPDDASHLVTIEVYDRAFDFDLGHVESASLAFRPPSGQPNVSFSRVPRGPDYKGRWPADGANFPY